MKPGSREAERRERRRQQIIREVWQEAEREFRTRAPHCLKKGHPERAAAWLRGADWCRAQWKATYQ